MDSETIKRNFYRGNYDSMREDLQNVDWGCIDSMNVEDSWNFFINKINNGIEKHVPLKRLNHNKKKQRWINSECLSSIKSKHKAWNR